MAATTVKFGKPTSIELFRKQLALANDMKTHTVGDIDAKIEEIGKEAFFACLKDEQETVYNSIMAGGDDVIVGFAKTPTVTVDTANGETYRMIKWDEINGLFVAEKENKPETNKTGRIATTRKDYTKEDREVFLLKQGQTPKFQKIEPRTVKVSSIEFVMKGSRNGNELSYREGKNGERQYWVKINGLCGNGLNLVDAMTAETENGQPSAGVLLVHTVFENVCHHFGISRTAFNRALETALDGGDNVIPVNGRYISFQFVSRDTDMVWADAAAEMVEFAKANGAATGTARVNGKRAEVAYVYYTQRMSNVFTGITGEGDAETFMAESRQVRAAKLMQSQGELGASFDKEASEMVANGKAANLAEAYQAVAAKYAAMTNMVKLMA